MRTITKTYNVYKYNELNEKAKEKVKQWYLSGQEPYFFTDIVKEDLYNLFGKNDLDVQYSLAYCQGDGFNIYGKINAESILKCLEDNKIKEFEKLNKALTEKDKKTILNYAEKCGEIELPYNTHYCYCISNKIDITSDWVYQLEYYSNYRNINMDVLNKFEYIVRQVFKKLCKDFEESGYDYFYEISDEELEDFCENNDFDFFEDGTVF